MMNSQLHNAAGRASTYGTLIRTFNSAQTLPGTLASLRAQSLPPDAWVFVDSGSTDSTATLVPAGATWHRYTAKQFNYSAALNEGLSLIHEPFVLIISSHTRLANPAAVAYGLALLEADSLLGGVYFSDDAPGALRHEYIDKSSFNGFNGLWNTCALIRVSLVRERSFREEVFAAEDQEWTAWLVNKRGGKVARILGGQRLCDNPYISRPQKRLNDYVSIAFYANRRLLDWSNIGRQFWLALGPGGKRQAGRRFYLNLAWRLALCHLRTPRYQSKYF